MNATNKELVGFLVANKMVKEGKKPDGAKNVTIKEGVMPNAQVAKWKR